MVRSLIGVGVVCLALSLSGCKGDPNTPEYWSKQIDSAKRVKDRVRVVADLRQAPALNASFLPMVHQKLASEKSPEVKAELARLLADQHDPSSVQPLIDALELGETDTAVKTMNKEIAHALAEVGDPKAIPTLVKLMRSKDNYTKIEAINALGKLEAKEAVEPLIALATDDNGEPFISKKAIQALGNIGDPRAVKPLVQMMFKERRGVSFYIESSFSLYQIGAPSVEALVPVMNGDDKELLAWTKEAGILEPAVYAKTAQVLADMHAHAKPAEKALIKQLGYTNGFAEQLLVRRYAALALGRMRSKAAVPVLAKMLDEPEASTRAEYITALVRIGDSSAVPALVKAAQQGSWDARKPAIEGIAMLGGEADIPAMEKLVKDEPTIHAAYCKTDPEYDLCKDVAASAKKQAEEIQTDLKRLVAAKECKKDIACWVKKLDDPDPGVRERAAYEVGRGNDAKFTDVLVKRLSDKNLDTRYAAITAADWLVTDNPEAFKTAKASLAQIQKQLEEEKGKTEFVKVNEDLKRLAVKLAHDKI
ncbi:MAG: HEAT repeat domain-containing protein [Myxococcaceae bacterium]|nr:HEAT repeat domain-containing protein [Myxococcaceae bacterium]